MSTPNPASTIKFQVNQPRIITLAFAEGRAVKSQFSGDQIMYTTTSGERFYVEPYVQQRIAAAGVTVGVPFELCKRETIAGNRRVVEMQVRALQPPNYAPPPPPPPVDSLEFWQQQPPPAPRAIAPPAPPPVPPPAAPPAPVNGAGQNAADIMTKCYQTAVDIALTAQKYAQERGLMLAPAFEDVRAMGTALFIQSQGGKR